MNRPWILVATAALILGSAGSALGATPAHVFDRMLKFETTYHFPTSECGPGSTEIASGNSHLIGIVDGDTFHFTFMETFTVHTIWDDGLFPDGYRQGTDAVQTSLTRGGVSGWHEAFHDFGPAGYRNGGDVKIHLYVRFIERDGEILVDRTWGRDLPPEGC